LFKGWKVGWSKVGCWNGFVKKALLKGAKVGCWNGFVQNALLKGWKVGWSKVGCWKGFVEKALLKGSKVGWSKVGCWNGFVQKALLKGWKVVWSKVCYKMALFKHLISYLKKRDGHTPAVCVDVWQHDNATVTQDLCRNVVNRMFISVKA